jgi:hypothetical protein
MTRLPTIEEFAEQLARNLMDQPTPRLRAKLEALIRWRAELREQDRRLLAGALRGFASRARDFAERVDPDD